MKNIKMPAGFAAISKAEQVSVSGGFTVRTRVYLGRQDEPQDDPRRRDGPRRRNDPSHRNAPRDDGHARIQINFSLSELFAGIGAIFAVFNPANWFSGFGRGSARDSFISSGSAGSGATGDYRAIKLF